MVPAPDLVDRFRSELNALVAAGTLTPDARLGLAVSGGPDSLALLLLSAAARPGQIEVATIDHDLRPESRSEAETVAQTCEKLDIPCAVLTIDWKQRPESAVQERARNARYSLLAAWAKKQKLDGVMTGHHLDDQVETFMMRLQRGSGIRGLAAMRRVVAMPGSDVPLIRPLLRWRRAELEQICAAAGVDPAKDPSNEDEQFERVRIRRALSDLQWLDPQSIGQSLIHLTRADGALQWAAAQEWERAVDVADGQIVYRPGGRPQEISRRIVARAIAGLANEGRGVELRGRELDRLLAALQSGGKATLRGVLCTGGEEWRFVPAPDRTRRGDNSR